MSSIEQMLIKRCKQIAVYWANPTPDGYGGKTFTDGVEIFVRWEDINEEITDSKGDQIISNAKVFTLQDVDEGGYLYLGELSGLDTDTVSPITVENAYEIAKFEKLPALNKTDKFVRVVHLNKRNSKGG